jgi:hypothetical protein
MEIFVFFWQHVEGLCILLQVVEPINRLLQTVEFHTIFYSLDWHPSDHVSFIDNLPQRKVHSSSPVSIRKGLDCRDFNLKEMDTHLNLWSQ